MSSFLLPGTCLHFLWRIGFSIPTCLRMENYCYSQFVEVSLCSQFVELSLCFGKCKSVCLSVCLSVCPQDLYFRTLSNGRYISSLRMIFVRRIRPLSHTGYNTSTTSYHGAIPQMYHTIYCVSFPYHTVNTYHTTYGGFPILLYTIPPTYISHVPYRVRQSELRRRLNTRPGACYCYSAVVLCKGGD